MSYRSCWSPSACFILSIVATVTIRCSDGIAEIAVLHAGVTQRLNVHVGEGGCAAGHHHGDGHVCGVDALDQRNRAEQRFEASVCMSVSVLSVSVTSTPLPTAIGVFGIGARGYGLL